MVKKLVISLLSLIICLHVSVSMAASTKTVKQLSEQSKEVEDKKEESEANSVELIMINYFQISNLILPHVTAALYHDYIVHYQAPHPKIPTEPPSII